MRRTVALFLLIAGIGLLAIGLNTANSAGDHERHLVAGAPLDFATGLTLMGTIAVVTGGLAIFTRRHN